MTSSSNKPVAGQAQATDDLFSDLRTMLNNPKFSDVHFDCKDGVQVHASRMLLAARSPKLDSILKDRTKDTINLPEFRSATLLAIFEFLYTGTVIEHAPLSSGEANELMRAAGHFELQLRNVEELVREFSTSDIADAADHITKAARMLSVVVKHSGTTSAIPLSLLRILHSEQLEPAHLRCLSKDAFLYFLERTQRITSNDVTVSFREYFRFRHIILWCLIQADPDHQAPLAFDSCLPDAKSAALLLRRLAEASSPPVQLDQESRSHLLGRLRRNWEYITMVKILLALVDYRRIDFELLVAVVEPFHLVPDDKLADAKLYQFRLHRDKGAARSLLKRWEHGRPYSVGENQFVIQKVQVEVGFARFNVPIDCPYGVYEWDIVVDQFCSNFCDIGVHYVDELQDRKSDFDCSELGKLPTVWALRHRDWKMSISPQGAAADRWKDVYYCAVLNDRITVHLDMLERSCSFSFGEHKRLVTWTNMPYGLYYPIVSLGEGTTNKGKVHITLKKGFEML